MNKSNNVVENIKKLSPYVKPYKWSFFSAILFVVIAAILNALAPSVEGLITSKFAEYAGDVFNNIPGAKIDTNYIISILIILFIIYVSYTLLAYASNILLTNSIQNSMRDLREAVQNKIKRLPISYFDGNSYGDVLSRITNDIDTISNALQQSFIQVIFSILAIILAISMMYSINVVMATIAIFIIPISYFLSKFIINKSQNLFDNQQNALGKLNGKVQELYTGFNEIKLYSKEEDSLKSFKEVNEELCPAII